jgi:hypothetical protein
VASEAAKKSRKSLAILLSYRWHHCVT